MHLFFTILIVSKLLAINCFQEEPYDSTDQSTIEYYENCSDSDVFSKLLPNDIEEGKLLPIRKYVSSINETKFILTRLAYVAQNAANVLLKPMQSQIIEFLLTSNLSTECTKALYKIYDGIRKSELWALKFSDTSGGIPKGITDGGNIDFGLYDHCVDITSGDNSDNSDNSDQTDITVRGQYCILKVILPLPTFDIKNADTNTIVKSFVKLTKPENIDLNVIKAVVDDSSNNFGKQKIDKTVSNTVSESSGVSLINFGICLPSQCTAKELENIANKALFPITRLPLEIDNCSVKQSVKYLDLKQHIAIAILGLLTLIVIISTLIEFSAIALDLRSRNTGTRLCDWIERAKKLSLISNTEKLFTEPSAGQLPAVDTLRLFGIIWIFVNHSYLLPSSHTLGRRGLYSYFHKVIHTNEYFFLKFFSIIEVFPLISGFVTTLSLMKGLEKSGGKFNFARFALNRYAKFTLALNGYLMFIYLQPLTGSGPLWSSFLNSPMVKSCDRFIDNNLLYYQNYQMTLENQTEYCVPFSWTLVVLMHLHLIAPAIILPLYYRPKIGLIINICAIIVGLMLNISPTVIFDKPPIQRIPDSYQQLAQSAAWYYIHTEQYVTTYSMGILVAFLALKYPKMNLYGKLGDTLLWLILPVVSASMVYWNEVLYELAWNGEQHITSALMFISIGKVLLASSFAWICYASYTNRGKFFLDILGNRNIRPFARLSFSVYMLQHAVIFQRIYTIREAYDFNDANVLKHTFEDIMLTTTISYLFYIIFECPVYYMYGLLMEKRENYKIDINDNNANANNVHSNDLNQDLDLNPIQFVSLNSEEENTKF